MGAKHRLERTNSDERKYGHKFVIDSEFVQICDEHHGQGIGYGYQQHPLDYRVRLTPDKDCEDP